MQANKDQDWTDDAAFWDDAWADMTTRLEEKPGSRKGALAWWLFYLGIAAVFGLVLAVGIGIIFDQGEGEAVSPPTLVRESLPADQTGVANSKAVIADASIGATVPEDKEELEPTKNDLPQLAKRTLPAGKPGQQGLTSNSPVTAPRRNVTPKRNDPSPASLTENDAAEEQISVAVKTPVARSPNSGNPVSWIATDLLKQDFIAEGIRPLESDQLFVDELNSLPKVLPQRRRHPNPLTLEAGLTSDFTLGHPGGMVGIGYRISGGKKLSFPLSLRYRLDELEVSRSPLEEADQTGVTTGGAAVEAADLLLIPQSISSTTVEVGAGLAWEVAPRFRLTSGFSAAYQVRALVNFEGQSTNGFSSVADNAVRGIYSLRLDRGEALLSNLSRDGISPDFNRWAFRANLGAAYDITPRLGVRVKATRLLAQPDRAGVIGLQTGRLELGVSYRLR